MPFYGLVLFNSEDVLLLFMLRQLQVLVAAKSERAAKIETDKSVKHH